MIKTGIAGGDARVAGELIRLLVNHPDIDLLSVSAPSAAKRSIYSFHHGLIGETLLNFSDHPDLDNLDVLFVCPGGSEAEEVIEDVALYPDLRVIDLSHRQNLIEQSFPAISEIYRKALVRGAKRATVMHPLTSMASVGLFPLAQNLLLNDDIAIKVSAPAEFISEESIARSTRQLNLILQDVQKSFDSKIEISGEDTGHNRSTTLVIDVKCSLPIDELLSVYENIYDDHNFTYITLRDIGTEEVSGTQKCIISLKKPDEQTLKLTVIGDCRLRGGAGDALHAMNLLFGLHERTGLALKSAKY